MLNWLSRTCMRFRRDERGGLAMLATGAIPVLTVLVGASIDYARVEDARSRLQLAADTAVLAVAQAQVLEIDNASTRADPLIDANFDIGRVRVIDRNVEERGRGYAEVTIRAEVDMFFIELVGYETMEIEVTAEAQFETSPDLEITVFLDNSASMLIGATPQDIAELEAMFGCAFACHNDIGGHHATYEEALDAGVATRLDVARDSILRTFEIADVNAQLGLSTTYFDIRTFSYGPVDIVRGTSTELLGSAGDAVRNIEPAAADFSVDVYAATDYAAAFTMADDVLAKVDTYPDREHFLLLITDGVDDFARARRNGSRRYIQPFDPDLCDEIKQRGVRVGVIYTTYFEIPSNSFWRNNVQPFNDQIGPSLAECATPGWYFEAQYAEDIDAAFRQLMELAMPKPQLTR